MQQSGSRHLHLQNVALLRSGARLASRLDRVAFGPSDGQSGVGAHLRHCMDSYRCFLNGLDVSGDRPAIDYDARQREADAERAPSMAAAMMRDLAALIERLSAAPEMVVVVKVDTSPEAVADPGGCWQQSTVGRELQFLISHTIHHYALIAMILRRQGIDPGDDFGVAPATLAHRREQSSCAQ